MIKTVVQFLNHTPPFNPGYLEHLNGSEMSVGMVLGSQLSLLQDWHQQGFLWLFLGSMILSPSPVLTMIYWPGVDTDPTQDNQNLHLGFSKLDSREDSVPPSDGGNLWVLDSGAFWAVLCIMWRWSVCEREWASLVKESQSHVAFNPNFKLFLHLCPCIWLWSNIFVQLCYFQPRKS